MTSVPVPSFDDVPGGLDARIEIAPGTDLSTNQVTWPWTVIGGEIDAEVGDRNVTGAISIRRGRPNEKTQASPSQAVVELDNSDGSLTPNNVESPYYPYLRADAGTPLRISIPGDATWLSLPDYYQHAGDGAYAADSAAMSVGDLWVAIDFTPRLDISDVQAHALIGKWVETGDQRSWSLVRGATTGRLLLTWSTDGATFQGHVIQTPPPSAIARQVTGVYLDVDNGAGQYEISLYVADDIAGPWTLVATEVGTTGTTAIFDSTAPVEIGTPTDGTGYIGATLSVERVHHAEIRDGDSTGTLAADPDFTGLAEGDTSFSDSVGNVWTVQGYGEVTDREYRMVGQIASVRPNFPIGDVTTADYSGFGTVTITAAGVLRRLIAGTKSLFSPMRRAVTLWIDDLPSGEVAAGYWPLEVTSGAANLVNGTVSTVTNIDFNGPPTPGSDLLANVSGSNARFVGTPIVPTGTTTWHTLLNVFVSTATLGQMGASDQIDFIRLAIEDGGTYTYARIFMDDSGDVYLEIGDASTSSSSLMDAVTVDAWSRIQLYYDGSDFYGLIAYDEFGTGTVLAAASNSVITSVSVTTPASVTSGFRFGHIYVWYDETTSSELSDFYQAQLGHVGEIPEDRFVRLCNEEGIEPELYPTTTPPAGGGLDGLPMGVQSIASFVTLLVECAVVGSGILSETPQALGLTYRPAGAMYNQEPKVTLDAQANEITFPFQTEHDDQRFRNEITAQRPGGASYTATVMPSPTPLNTYQETVVVNVEFDGFLPSPAGWRLHTAVGSLDRVPSVVADLAQAPDRATEAMTLREGDLIRVSNLPAQYKIEYLDLIVEGIQPELIGPRTHKLTLTCSDGGVWTVGVLDDEVLGRLSPTDATLVAAITDTDTSFSVASVGAVWVDLATYPTQFPFDIEIGGEQMTVTDITGTSSPQVFTVTRTVNGIVKAHDAGASVLLHAPLVLAL